MADNQATVIENPIVTEDLTPAELEYFNSRGAKTDGLIPPADGAQPQPQPDPNAAGAAAAAAAAAPAPGATEDELDVDDAAALEKAIADGKTPKRVNFNKYRRLQERADKAEKDLAAERDRYSRADERMRLIQEAMTAAPAGEVDEDPRPDPEKDLLAYLHWQDRELNRQREWREEVEERERTRQQEAETVNWYRQDAYAYAQNEPSFGLAYQHLINDRNAELQRLGVNDANERMRILVAEEKDIVARARANRASPADVIFKLSVGRGFNKEAAMAAAQNGGTAPAAAQGSQGKLAPGTPLGGGAPASASLATANPAGAPSVAAEIDAIKRAQPASTSLSGAGGAPAQVLTPQMLADMPQEEFEAVLARLSKTRQRELLGS